jgi:hypothetical protein
VNAGESLGIRAVVVVDPTSAAGDDAFHRCASAIASVAPELAEVLVCIEA